MSMSHKHAWAAGFFDGEGYVTIMRDQRKYKDKLYNNLMLRIGINHVKIDPLLEMQKLFGGNVRVQNVRTIVGNRKQRHSWQINSLMAKNALIIMLPYLINKCDVVALGLEFQDTKDPENTCKLSDEMKLKRDTIRLEIKRLNSLS